MMSTDFGADSLSRFPFKARTNKQTNRQMQLNALPHAGAIQPVWVIKILIHWQRSNFASNCNSTTHKNSYFGFTYHSEIIINFLILI